MPIANITLDCVNGISKQDAETLKALPDTLDAIEDSIGDANDEIDGIKDSIDGMDNRITALETAIGAGNDWELFTGTDWSEFSTDGKANQDLIIELQSNFQLANGDPATSPSMTTDTITEIRYIHKGDVLSNSAVKPSYNAVVGKYKGIFSGGTRTYEGFLIGTYEITGSNILTNTTIDVNATCIGMGMSGGEYYEENAASTSPRIHRMWNRVTRTLTKNGTSTYSIRLYYRPKE